MAATSPCRGVAAAVLPHPDFHSKTKNIRKLFPHASASTFQRKGKNFVEWFGLYTYKFSV